MGCGASSARHTPNFALAEPPPEPRAPQTPPSPQTPPAGTQSSALDGALADDAQSAAAEQQAADEGARGKDAIDLDVLDDPDRPPLHGLQPHPESVRRTPAAYSLRRNSSRPGSRPQSRGQVGSRPVTAESAVSDGIEHGGEGEPVQVPPCVREHLERGVECAVRRAGCGGLVSGLCGHHGNLRRARTARCPVR